MRRRSPQAERFILFGVASLIFQVCDVAAQRTTMPGDADFTQAIEQDELGFHAGDHGGWMAFNRWQGLVGMIDADGFSIRGPLPDTRWSERFNVLGIGRSEGLEEGSTCDAMLENERTLTWNGSLMDVQYMHDEQGLRQNFIVHQRMLGNGPLQLHLGLSGDLAPILSDNNELAFLDAQCSERFRYRDLKVFDACGERLEAHMELADAGQLVIAVMDEDATYPVTIDPVSQSYNTILFGTAGFEFAVSVATAGDLNGDGFSDVVVGAWQATLGQSQEGAAYVYYGSSSGISTTASVVLESNQAVAQFGTAVSTAGDVNGDGYSDLLVGARTWEDVLPAQSGEGGVFVYHGGPAGIATTPNYILQPNHASDNFGSYVTSAGDINNDGYSDVLVSAYLADYGGFQEGTVFVFVGSATGLNPVWVHRLDRNQSAAHFGHGISSAGDINGDGFSDVIVGSSKWIQTVGGNDQGAAFIWYGSASNLGGSLNPPPALTIFGSGTNSAQFGWSVACAGDVNGDGYSDVAVSAYGDTNGQSQEGTVRVYHGSAAGLVVAPAALLESNQANAWFGRSVFTAGDLNGDGYSDLVVGATKWTNPQSLEGGCFVYFGSPTGVPLTPSMTLELNVAGANFGEAVMTAGDVNGDGYSDMILSARNYAAAAVYFGGPYTMNLTSSRTWTGGTAANRFGSSVANAGDVNGDGYADALIGAPNASNGQAGEGLVYFYTGSATGLGAAPALTLEANIAGAQFGASTATAGDVNGDGYADVVVGAPQSGGIGRAYVYMGSPGGLSAAPVLTLNGSGASRYGASVSTAGDINADGYADLLIGAPNISTAYLHLGSPAGTVAAPATTLNEAPASNLFGTSVCTAGDVNGDGRSDIIIGAPGYSNGQAGEGVAFVYHGSSTGLVTPWARRLEVNQAGAAFGTSVAGAGDVNGNGFYEVIVGAELWDNGQADEGGAFVFYGSNTGTNTAGYTAIERNVIGAHLGHSVAEAGDMNGDGYADVVVGAPLSENGQSDEGIVYVLRGSSTGLVTATFDALEPNSIDYWMGNCVSGGGDVDGDGYSDVLTGAPNASPALATEGSAYWYRGNLARSLGRLTRQYDADLVTPLSTNSIDLTNPGFFGIGHKARSPIQRSELRLRWEVVNEGQAFTGSPITNSVLSTGTSAAWTNAPVNGVEIKQLIAKTAFKIRYKWRVRVEYPTEKMIDGQRFSRWFYGYAAGLGDIGVLPIELVLFDGQANGPANDLFWITATESNSDHFIVERGQDGVDFEAIGSVSAAGSSQSSIDYSFTDHDPPFGRSFYRLRMVDVDGSEDTSPVINIVRAQGIASIFPNPTAQEITLLLDAHSDVRRLVVMDDLGRTVEERRFDSGDVRPSRTLSLERLRAGYYTMVLMDGQGAVLDRLPFVKR